MKKIISALIALIVVLSLCSCAKNVTDNGNKIEQEIQVLNEVNSGFNNAQKPFMDGEYVKTDSVKECLQSAYNYALSLVDDGIAEYAKIEGENLCVICKLMQGDKVIYIPKMDDVKAGGGINRVLTAQPYYSTHIKSDAPDKAAKRIDSKIKSYCFNDTDNLDDKEINIDSLKNLKGTKVIIWDGHGGYNSEDHSFIGISVSYESLKKSEKFSSYCDGKQIIESTDGDALLTSIFFKGYYNTADLDGAVIYLGTCSSGRDSVLADTLISKGAKAVFGNTNTTKSGYDGRMIESIFSAMADGKTAEEALKFAKNKNGEKGPLIIELFELSRTEVKLLGNSANNYTLYKEESNAFKNSSIGKKLTKNSWSFASNLNSGLVESLSFNKNGKVTEERSDETTQETASTTCKLINDTTIQYVIKFDDGFSNKVTLSLIDNSQFVKAVINNSQVTDFEDLLYNRDTVDYSGSNSEYNNVLIGDWNFSGSIPFDTIHIYEYEYGIKASVTLQNGEIADEIPVFTFSNTFAKMYVFDSANNTGITLYLDRNSDTKVDLISFNENYKLNTNYGALIKQ